MIISQKKLKTIQYSCEELTEYVKKNHYRVKYNSWEIISKYQTLSEDFIREFQCDLCLHTVARYQKISAVFALELDMFSYIDDILINKNMTEEEKEEVVTTLKLVKLLT